jgi:hypothetical protein
MRFGLVIWFIEHLQIVTTSNYSTIANSHCAIYYSTYVSLLSLLCFHQLSGNDFQQCPLLPCSRSYWLATVPQLLTLNWTRLYSTNWTQLSRSSGIASEQTQQKTQFLCWCEGHGITCSIAAALSAWCRTAWQHHFLQSPIVAWHHRRCKHEVFLCCVCDHRYADKLSTVP